MQKAHAHYIAIQISRPAHHVRFYRRFRSRFKGRPRAYVRYAATPPPVDQSCGYVNSAAGDYAIVRLNVGRREPYSRPAFGPVDHRTFHAIRPPEHAPREIYSPLKQ